MNLFELLPVEIKDQIFLYLDHPSLIMTRELQSDHVKKVTEYENVYDASKFGNLACVKYLHSIGKGYIYAIENAAGNGHVDIVSYLLLKITDTKTLSNALQYAQESKHSHIVFLILCYIYKDYLG